MSTTPDTSFKDRFSREGRLKRQWAKASEAPDARRALDTLREVAQSVAADVERYGHLWPELIGSMLDEARLAALTDDDFEFLEALAATLPHHAEALLALASARTTREDEGKARTLLARAFDAGGATPETRSRAVRELARRRAASDDHVRIYACHLAEVGSSDALPEVVSILTRVLTVDFDSDRVALKRAEELACLLVDRDVDVPGIRTALGVAALRLEGNHKVAAAEFRPQLNRHRHDSVAAIGLLAALLQNREYDAAAKASTSIAEAAGSKEPGLLILINTLAWLDGEPTMDAPPDARTVEGLGVERYAPDACQEAIGRLHLLEGDSTAAHRRLMPLARSRPEHPQLAYHAAWAALLTADRDGLVQCVELTKGWGGHWTVLCRLLDVDWATALQAPALKSPKGPLARSITCLTEMARGASPPPLNTAPVGTSPEERLELHRIALGVGLFAGDAKRVKADLQSSHLRRLPKADGTMWKGLAELLLHDAEKGAALLEEAARNGGHPRAALILAVHRLRANKLAEAKQDLELGAQRRKDVRMEVLRAWIAARERRFDAAVKHLDGWSEPFAVAALGEIYLQCAEDSQRAGRSGRAAKFRNQAASAVHAALERGQAGLPADMPLLGACLDFAARPLNEAERLARSWSVVSRLPASTRNRWVTWHCALATVLSETTEAVDAAEWLVEAVQDVSSLPQGARAALAQAIARIGSRRSGQDETGSRRQHTGVEKCAELVASLANGTNDEGVRRWAAVGQAQAARAYNGAGKASKIGRLEQLARADQSNGELALVLAAAHLTHDDRASAHTALAASAGVTQPAKAIREQLAAVLAGSPEPPALPDPGVVPASMQCTMTLLHALQAFSASDPEAGYRSLLTAARTSTSAVAKVIDVSRGVAPLVAQTAHGGSVPPVLIETIRQVADSAQGSNGLVLARCAAVAGETDLAVRLWEKALDGDDDHLGPDRQELAGYLCHVATAALGRGDDVDAARALRKAAVAVGGSPVSVEAANPPAEATIQTPRLSVPTWSTQTVSRRTKKGRR